MSGGAVRRRVIVRGLVQGVFFRDTLRRQAERLGIAGWTRNRADGALEAVFEGPPAAVDEMVALCRRGPPAARVESVESSAEHVRGERGFAIR